MYVHISIKASTKSRFPLNLKIYSKHIAYHQNNAYILNQFPKPSAAILNNETINSEYH